MKLELKYLAPYLPHSLQCVVIDIGETIKAEMNSVYKDGTCTFHDLVESEKGFESIKPILRPLSDLKREINGDYFWLLIEQNDKIFFEKTKPNISEISVRTYNNLLEYKFDIFGLIPAGLAIDINTLEK